MGRFCSPTAPCSSEHLPLSEAGSDHSRETVKQAEDKDRKVEVYPVLSTALRQAGTPLCPQSCSPCRPISKHTFQIERDPAEAVNVNVSKCVCSAAGGGGGGGGRGGGRRRRRRGRGGPE